MINNKPLRVAVTGVTGRMGKMIIQCLNGNQQNQRINKEIVLGAAISRCRSKVVGMNIRTINGSNDSGIIITDNISLVKEHFDVLIDFTSPESTIEYLNFCVMNHKNMIIGTTGFDKKHLSLIQNASQKIGIVYSANFSIGVTVMLKLLAEISVKIGSFFDIDIIEAHHNKKIDIPSGTALMMRDIIKNSIEKSKLLCNKGIGVSDNDAFQNELLYILSSNSSSDISIHSIRSGNIIGEHTVLFSGSEERLEIAHKVSDRSIFANGALYSALWLRSKKIGLFDLNTVLGFSV